jgi:hypothetical protein
MAAPTVHFYINVNTEASPTWTEIVTSDVIKPTGPDTTASPESYDPVTAPGSGCKIAEELWIDDASAASAPWAFQCATYDGTINTAQNVFRIFFETNPTSTAPILTAYDTSAHAADPAKEICTGTTTTGSTGFLKAIETTGGQPGASWATCGTASAGASTTNCLDGDQRYVQCAAAASANTQKLFNLVCYVPDDAGAGTTGHDPVVTCKYTYT